jgi:[acyl-carrier-protein] S-malonyltransferase
MSARLLLLCPGQGNQHLHMFDLARTSTAGAALLDQLAPDLPPLDQDHLFANASAQPLIVAATLAMWEALRADASAGPPPAPALVAGYSIGELSAYAVAGALSPQDAVQLATRRAALMNACRHTHPEQSLVALSGLVLPQIAQIAAGHAFSVSIETSDDSCIAGGPAPALAALQAEIAAAGGRSQVLPVEVASHTPYMADAVIPFAEELQAAAFRPQQTPVVAGIDATNVMDKQRAVSTLSRQLAEPIRWLACMDAFAEAGITAALELGPGGALSRMLQTRHPHISTRSVADFRTLDGVRKWLDRAMERG